MKKFHLLAAATILSTTSVFTSMPGTDVYAAKNVTTEGRKAIKQQEDVKRIADQFVESRYKIGDENWKAFKVRNILPLMDENHEVSKFLVEFTKKSALSGYAIIDLTEENGYEVVEFALGDVHPFIDLKQNEQGYFFGPLTYAMKDNSNEITDLKYKKKITEEDLEQIRNAKKKQKNNDETNKKSTKKLRSVINRDYDYITGVPDYQQDDNGTWTQDCSPTAGANVMVYWDANGFPNLHTTTRWQDVANTLGNLMGTNDPNGTTISNINPALLTFAQNRGYTNFTSTMVSSPSFSNIDAQIEARHPAIVT